MQRTLVREVQLKARFPSMWYHNLSAGNEAKSRYTMAKGKGQRVLFLTASIGKLCSLVLQLSIPLHDYLAH